MKAIVSQSNRLRSQTNRSPQSAVDDGMTRCATGTQRLVTQGKLRIGRHIEGCILNDANERRVVDRAAAGQRQGGSAADGRISAVSIGSGQSQGSRAVLGQRPGSRDGSGQDLVACAAVIERSGIE